MAKRSPILGYNHNVRYRGLIFHVQTEDSGQLSPHLFTHVFHGGVIISSRKLVYDSGAAEDAIKALMQAQHKVMLRDLKKGVFDDKVDQYLGEAPGLLPRGASDLPTEAPVADQALPLDAMPPRADAHHAVPVFPPEVSSASQVRTAPPIPPAAERTHPQGSTMSARGAAVPASRPFDDLDPPTLIDAAAEIEAALGGGNTVKTRIPSRLDSSPEIFIGIADDNADAHAASHRAARDTDVQMFEHDSRATSDGVPGSMGGTTDRSRHAEESVPPLPPPPERRTGDRGSAVGAASLPPARPIARPPTRPPFMPPVASRQLPSEEGRLARESDAVQVYAPALPAVEAPPGEAGGRAGEYAQYKRPSARISEEIKPQDRSGSIPIPAGLARPGRAARDSSMMPIPRPITNPPSPSPVPQAVPNARATAPTRPADQASRPNDRSRTPTAARTSGPGPMTGRGGQGASGGVVMTRPAVIVGAPPKPAVPPRVRKAREDEGRGFGQGLISEKSLDEVILAYLSEDADDK